MELTQGLHRAVQQSRDAPMTIFGDRVQSCAAFEERVARLAGALLKLNVRAGDRVGMLALNSDRYLEYLAAVPWAGAVLNPVNIRWSTQEVVYSLVDSGTTVLLVDDAFASKVPEIVAGCDALTHVVFCGEGPVPDGALALEQLVADAVPVPDARRGGGDLAGIFYTGGTTGFPKGVMLSHRAIVSSALGSLASGQFLRPGGQIPSRGADVPPRRSRSVGGADADRRHPRHRPGVRAGGRHAGDRRREGDLSAPRADDAADAPRSSSGQRARPLEPRVGGLWRLSDQPRDARAGCERPPGRRVHAGLRHDRARSRSDPAGSLRPSQPGSRSSAARLGGTRSSPRRGADSGRRGCRCSAWHRWRSPGAAART